MWATTPFEPWMGLAGGLLIGIAVVLLILSIGCIAGISGIIAGALTKKQRERHWRVAFLLGLVLASITYRLLVNDFPVVIQQSTTWMIVAGLLVGFGTRVGCGCTSGHGVAGIARMSTRSIVATMIFIITAAATVGLFRHW